MKIIFTGGGTMGHIFPIIAVIRELRNLYPGDNLNLYYIGPKHAYGEILLREENVKIKKIVSGKIRRYFSFLNFIDMFKVPIGIIQSIFWVFVLAPDIVFSKGGYGSFPVSFACGFLRTPLILQESDIIPGLTSKLISKWALEIFTSFPETEYFNKEKVTFTGNPIRMKVLEGSIEKAKQFLNLKKDRPIILILGGSQGSQTINNLILEILPQLIKKFEIIHQTGSLNQKKVLGEAKAILKKEDFEYYHPFPFLNEEQLSLSLKSCDFIISRAGSGALFEIASLGKPSILIPLSKSAQDHQKKNAYAFFEKGASEVIEEQNLKPNFFLQKIESLIQNKETLEIMAQNAKTFSKPKAAKKIASYLLEYLSLD